MKKLVLLDMDGTVYLGNQLFPCVPDLFKFFEKNNIEFVFLTNNSSHSKEFYEQKMNKMGVKCDAHNFYTSVETTIRYLKKQGFKTLYVLGVKSFKEKLAKEFTLVNEFNPDKIITRAEAAELSFKLIKQLETQELSDINLSMLF